LTEVKGKYLVHIIPHDLITIAKKKINKVDKKFEKRQFESIKRKIQKEFC